MPGIPTFTVRPLSKPARNDMKDSLRIYLSPASLLQLKLKAGDTSKTLQSIYGFTLGEKVSVVKDGSPVALIGTAFLEEVTVEDITERRISRDDASHWEWMLEGTLERAEILVPGMTFENVLCLGHFRSGSRVKIMWNDRGEIEQPPAPALRLDGQGGLTSQIQSINEVLEDFDDPPGPGDWEPRPGGILLFGSTGTGKSMLLEKIAALGWGKVFYLDRPMVKSSGQEAAAAIKKIFSDAKSYPRSVVIMDNLEQLASKEGRQDGDIHEAATLQAAFKSLDAVAMESQVLVVAATSRIHDLDASLRRPKCFAYEIEIPIPNAMARKEILKSIVGVSLSAEDALLDDLGERTHGFTGSDLDALMFKAGWEAKRRRRARPETNGDPVVDDGQHSRSSEPGRSHGKGHGLCPEDIERAMLVVRPTAMREVFLEVPKVRWTDIGGQDHVKRSLREAIEWSLKVSSLSPTARPPRRRQVAGHATDRLSWQDPARVQRLGLQVRKGLLLYGPPGCSKTLIAKALATESGLNFLAVKGAELLNMYVGESERALRAVFAKARAASPSIIFFDEIDAIARSRGSGGGAGAGSAPSGLNVLTTLLNEMDGIESLRGVTVLAATNQPEVLDLALMRPGRLDTILYVGLPDQVARRAILQSKLARMDTGPDVDVEHLARLTHGYTGAEVVHVCDTAGHRAFQACEHSGREEQISREHFLHALAQVPRQITPALQLAYERWSVGGVAKV
ncbi:MAG: AAA+-type ATPase [Phylliscum demangeonii]|nr:MAG: AAA+-type ATPase [Phylliscum demangeonii]